MSEEALWKRLERSQSTLFPAEILKTMWATTSIRFVRLMTVLSLTVCLDLGKLGFGRVVPLEQETALLSPMTLLGQDIHLWLSQSGLRRAAGLSVSVSVISSWIWLTGASGAGLQDHYRFPQGQWQGDY